MTGSIKIEMPPPIAANFTCYAHSELADHFLLAAAGIPTRVKFSLVRYFLCCQALELGLKAFLSLKGLSNSDLKKIGHDLVALLDRARAH